MMRRSARQRLTVAPIPVIATILFSLIGHAGRM
jgi:hypothetical protein